MNTYHILNKMIVDMSHHKMILTRRLVRIPRLCQCRHSLVYLITISWKFILVKHFIKQVTLSVVQKSLEQIRCTYITCRKTILMTMNISNERINKCLLLSIGIKSEYQRYCISCLTFRNKLFDECLLDLIRFVNQAESLSPTIIMGRSYQCYFCILTKSRFILTEVVPITKSHIQNVILCF